MLPVEADVSNVFKFDGRCFGLLANLRPLGFSFLVIFGPMFVIHFDGMKFELSEGVSSGLHKSAL